MAYTNSIAVTIIYGLCGDVASTDFPFLFSSTYAPFATVANSGQVQNTVGSGASLIPCDLIFSSANDLTGGSILPFEIISYNATTGQVIAYVQIPTLSVSQNTIIYVVWGNSAVSTDQSNAAAVWTNSFLSVYHFGSADDGGTFYYDSTGNNPSPVNHGVTQVTGGPIFDAGAFASASSEYIDTGNHQNTTTGVTVEAWVKCASAANFAMVASNLNDAANVGYELYIGNGSGGLNPTFQVANSAGLSSARGTTAISGTGVWASVAGTSTSSPTSGNLAVYLNGVSQSISASYNATAIGTSPYDVDIGKRGNSSNGYYFNGDIAEVRISSVVRSASWLIASYNNQASPSTFYYLGPYVPAYVQNTTIFSATSGNATASVAYPNVPVPGDLLLCVVWGGATSSSPALPPLPSIGTPSTTGLAWILGGIYPNLVVTPGIGGSNGIGIMAIFYCICPNPSIAAGAQTTVALTNNGSGATELSFQIIEFNGGPFPTPRAVVAAGGNTSGSFPGSGYYIGVGNLIVEGCATSASTGGGNTVTGQSGFTLLGGTFPVNCQYKIPTLPSVTLGLTSMIYGSSTNAYWSVVALAFGFNFPPVIFVCT